MSTVLITGASSGIGAELARAHARRGDSVVLLARRSDRLQQLAKEISELGVRAWVFTGDVRREGDIAAAIAALATEQVSIDRVYANAGFGVAGAIQRLELADYRRQFETNVFGLLSTVYETLPALRASRGQLVLIGSVAGHVSAPGASAYSASKFAVRALAEALRGDLAMEGIRVTLVSPGFVDSDIRRTNNQGALREDAKDPIPAWLRVPTESAVRSMLKGVDRGRAEVIVTGHGKLIVFLARHLPGLVRFLTSRAYRARPEPR